MWAFLAKLAFTLIISYALRPPVQKQKPPELEDIDVPVAEEGKPIPVVFGRRHVADPNVVWYGDLHTESVYD